MKRNRLNLTKVLGRCAVALCCAALLLFSSRTNSQEAGKGSIQGIVSDPSGAVVASASVTLAESATGTTLSTKSDGSGVYSFPKHRHRDLYPHRYRPRLRDLCQDQQRSRGGQQHLP